jgi:hypothetical protein
MVNQKDTSVVKIDSLLLDDVEKFIRSGENRLRFANKKHFIDIAVLNYLKKMERGNENG